MTVMRMRAFRGCKDPETRIRIAAGAAGSDQNDAVGTAGEGRG